MKQLAVVTGASAGLGHAIAEALLDRGWQVLGVSRRTADIEHADYADLCCDLADAAALDETFGEVFATRYQLASRDRVALINNAGVLGPVGPLSDAAPAAFNRTLALNVTAPAILTGRFVKWCAEVPLRVVNISSGAAHRPIAGWAAYCASKAALHMLGAMTAAEVESMPAFAGRDVRVLGFAPGVVDTAMQGEIRARSPDELPGVQRFLDLHADGELLPPEKPAAEIAEWLARDTGPRWEETRVSG